MSAKAPSKGWSTLVTAFACALLGVWLMPLAYSVVTSIKSDAQQTSGAILPRSVNTALINGEEFDLLEVPFESGTRTLALVDPGRKSSGFIDLAEPDVLIEWEGAWRQLEPSTSLDPQWGNFRKAWDTIDFLNLLRNTVFYAVVSTIGAVVSSAFVAYGFARFEFRGKGVLFIILMGTILLPPAVTTVPQFWFFSGGVVDWNGTWWPLIVPQFFANAYNVFLLRQFFLSIPRELEEAASIDGAGPLRTFVSVIVPNAKPAFVAVSLFHFFFAWNDFFGPLLYLSSAAESQPISLGLTLFNGLYRTDPTLVMAASLIALIIPVTIFFLAQRVFIEGIVITGVDK